jgi:tryptophan 7-halogenase
MGTVEADLWVDCTGPGAALLAQLPGFAREDWKGFLPIRALVFDQLREPMLGLEDRITLSPVGWLSHMAGRDGRQAVLAMIEGTTLDDAHDALPVEQMDVVPIDPGRVAEAWLGNVVALGDAAAQFEPLGWFNLDLAHRQLDLLLELLPGRTVDPRERGEFNRRAALMADRVRDLLGAHYAAPGAAHLGPLERSDELARALDQHARRGRLPFFEEAPLQVQECSALLQALGHRPGEGPLAIAADPQEAEAARVAFEAKVLAALYATRPYGEWIGETLRG